MLDFLFKKETTKDELLNSTYSKLKEIYKYDEISIERKEYLSDLLNQYGYLPYPYMKALEELSPAEILFALEIKWKNNKIFDGEKFTFDNDKISPLARKGATDSDWLKKEGHDIKLINLAGLGNGNITQETGKFIDWLRQLLILPTGNVPKGIMDTTIYLIPFHPREFGCAYLPTSTDVSKKLYDETLPMEVKEQVQTFISLAQLAGHPVIYDVLPQTGRFAKIVLANPYIARWFDVTDLLAKFENSIDLIASKLSEKLNPEDVDVVKDIFKQTLHSGAGELTEYYQAIYNDFAAELDELKKQYSNEMMERSHQAKIQKRVREVVAKIHGEKPHKQFKENEITKQGEAIKTLIKEGLWPAPGGAWCSAGIPVFDKMSECGSYPMFNHFDHKGEDVTNFANLDCQTPFYFVFLESGKYNYPVIDFFIDYMKKLQSDYNFDGYRVDHIDHIVDEVSQKDGLPISYRAPSLVLCKLNSSLKNKIPYFGTLAEYMLWDKFYKEYHEDMKFDILWGNDIISQFEKTPEQIVEDNQYLASYNSQGLKGGNLSILKTYNNQDGEFRVIDQYPGQLGEAGALFKWFKYKFLPGGRNAQRPVLYVDGDESFTKTGIESVIGNEVSMPREDNYDFYAKFDAIDRFVKTQDTITQGEAQIVKHDEDGFVAWMISKEPSKTAFLILANYNYPVEKVTICDKEGNAHTQIKEGVDVLNKTIQLPCDINAVAEYKFDGKDYSKIDFTTSENCFCFDKLEPAEFKIFLLQK